VQIIATFPNFAAESAAFAAPLRLLRPLSQSLPVQ
jgi:hypothetical protein